MNGPLETSTDRLVAAIEKWNESRLQWERAKVQWAQARPPEVPPLAKALMKVQVDTLEAQTFELFEAAMVFMDRRPLDR